MQANTTETEKFAAYVQQFFDIFNTRAIEEADQKNKPDLKPFYSSGDERLEVICYWYVSSVGKTIMVNVHMYHSSLST